MEVRESFIFHAEYIADIPEELQPQYAMYAINYALKGIEPELTDWRDVKMWNSIKNRIDGEAEQYEATIKARAAAGRNHKGNQYTRKNQEEPKNNDLEQNGTEWNKMEQDGTNGTVSVFESEFVSEHETENEFVPAASAPGRETPSVVDYSNRIYEVFHEAGLPCARNNPISFLQRDFKNAMAFIHKTDTLRKIPPDDIIAACKNYAKTVNDPRSFINGKYSFERLVTFKNFVDYLPENYVPDNFIDEKKAEDAAKTVPKKAWQYTCIKCGAKAMGWDNEKQKYRCTQCGREFKYEEVNR